MKEFLSSTEILVYLCSFLFLSSLVFVDCLVAVTINLGLVKVVKFLIRDSSLVLPSILIFFLCCLDIFGLVSTSCIFYFYNCQWSQEEWYSHRNVWQLIFFLSSADRGFRCRSYSFNLFLLEYPVTAVSHFVHFK